MKDNYVVSEKFKEKNCALEINMNKFKIMAVAMLLTFSLTACGKSESSSQLATEPLTEIATEPLTQPPVTEAKPVEISVVNPLTGESGFNEEAVGNRPVAVMVSNIKDALPQYGVEDADIIYELPVEGGITRLMAVYADYTDVPDICSVRSCRYYYPILAYGMDAIYCHWGSDKTIALDTLYALDIDRFDGNETSLGYGTVFERDNYRLQNYATEHTGCLRGERLEDAIASIGYRTEINDINKNGAFNFNAPDSPTLPIGEECEKAVLEFSNEYYSTFEYDKENGVYLKYHSGSPHNDGVTGNQLSFTNVFVLETYMSRRNDGKLLNIGLDGGEGYYISMGREQEITWSKESNSSPIRVYDENGNELTVNAGKSYIGFIDDDGVELD